MKKYVLHATILMHSKARHCLRDLFSNNHRNGSEMTYVAGVTKNQPQKFENLDDLDDLMQVTI